MKNALMYIKSFLLGFFNIDLGDYVLVKDNNEIMCKHIDYYEDKSVYGYHYLTEPFSSKEAVKNYNYMEHNYLRAGWYGGKTMIFHSKESAIDFLKENIKNKNEYRVLNINELDLPEHDEVTV